VPSLVLSGTAAPLARLTAYLLIAGNVLQLWHPKSDSLDKVVEEVRRQLGSAVGEPGRAVSPVKFRDVLSEALVFPTPPTTQLDAGAKLQKTAANYSEEKWAHHPLRSLPGAPPIDAAGPPTLRKKLRGVIQSLQESPPSSSPRLYDFALLRHK